MPSPGVLLEERAAPAAAPATPPVHNISIRRHAPAVVAIALLAAMLVGPRIWRLTTDSADGVRVQVSPWASTMSNDEALYAPQLRRAYEGHVPIADPYLAHEDAEPQAEMFWQELIGVLGHPLGGPYVALAIVAAIAVVAAFALLYALGFELTGSTWTAIAVIPIALLMIEVLNQAEGILPLRHWNILREVLTLNTRRDFHVWSRFVAPLLTLPFFFAAVIALPRAVGTGAKRWIGAASVALAVLVYSYVFYWTAFAIAIVGWAVWLLLVGERTPFRRLALIVSIATLLALPELIVLSINALTLTADAKARTGLGDPGIIVSSAPSIAQRVLVGLPFLWMLVDGPPRNRLYIALFFAPLVLAGVGGVLPQPWHFTTQIWAVFAIPAVVAGSAAFARSIPRSAARYAAFALGGLAAAGIVHFGVIQVRATRAVDETYAVTNDERAAFDWINEHVSDDETVVTPSVTTNMLLASLTHAREYVPDGFYSKTERDDEIVDRYLRVQAAYGLDENTTFARLDPLNIPFRDLSGSVRAQETRLESSMAYYLLNWETQDPDTVTRRFPSWRSRFEALRRQPNVLSAHPAQYLYCGQRERMWHATRPLAVTWVAPAFRQGEVSIYRVSSAADPEARPFAGCAGE